uniref:Uncharacterized protein n=1 Tax=viral metagenome TaxID=1070528 RepID=A0A6C0D2I9_9ZZZZ
MQGQNFCARKTIKPTVENYGSSCNNIVKAVSGRGSIDVCVSDKNAAKDRLTHEIRGGKDYIKCTYPADYNYGCSSLIYMMKKDGVLWKYDGVAMSSPLNVSVTKNNKLTIS